MLISNQNTIKPIYHSATPEINKQAENTAEKPSESPADSFAISGNSSPQSPVKASDLIFNNDRKTAVEKIILLNHPDVRGIKFEQQWEKKAGDYKGYDAPVTLSEDGKTAYLGGRNSIMSVDAISGNVNFESQLKGQVFTPAVVGPTGNIFVTCYDYGKQEFFLYGIDGNNGGKNWCVEDEKLSIRGKFGSPVSSLAVTSDNKVLVGTREGTLRIYDGHSGKYKKEIILDKDVYDEMNKGIISSIIGRSSHKKLDETEYHISMDKNDNVYISSFTDGILYIVDGKKGEMKKKINLHDACKSGYPRLRFSYPPTIGENGKVYFSDSFTRFFYAYDTENEKMIWQAHFPSSPNSPDIYVSEVPPAIGKNKDVILAMGKSSRGGIMCVDEDMGFPKWKLDIDLGVKTQPVFSEDGKTIFVGAEYFRDEQKREGGDMMIAIDSKTGLIKGKFNIYKEWCSIFGPGNNIVITPDNTVIAGFGDANVHSFSLTDLGPLKIEDGSKTSEETAENDKKIVNEDDDVIIDGIKISKKRFNLNILNN